MAEVTVSCSGSNLNLNFICMQVKKKKKTRMKNGEMSIDRLRPATLQRNRSSEYRDLETLGLCRDAGVNQ